MRSLVIALTLLFRLNYGAKEQNSEPKELSELRLNFAKEYNNSLDLLTQEIVLQVGDILSTQKFNPVDLSITYLDEDDKLDFERLDQLMTALRMINPDEEELGQLQRMFWKGVEYLSCLKYCLIKGFIEANPLVSLAGVEEFLGFYPHLKYSSDFILLSHLYIVYFQFISGGSIFVMQPRKFAFGDLKVQMEIIRNGYKLGKKTNYALEKTIGIFKFFRLMLSFNYTAENRILMLLMRDREINQRITSLLTEYLNQISCIDAMLRVVSLW